MKKATASAAIWSVLAATAALAGAGQSTQPAAPPSAAPPETRSAPPVEPRWLARLPKIDRALIDDLVGYAPPAFTEDLTWIGADRRTWDDLRGRVVLIQTWTTRTAAGRGVATRLARTLSEIETPDLEVILLHTPEGAENVQRFLDRRPVETPIVIDSRGGFCDDLGVYKRPVNILVDRTGTVRYAGLNARGLAPALTLLMDEPYDATKTPPVREDVEVKPAAEFPPCTGTVSKANDVRGRRAPELYVQEWITNVPDGRGKVTVVEFWGTWCGPCVRSIPHMNELADRFRNEAVIIGISYEDSGTLHAFMQNTEIRYAVASDQTTYDGKYRSTKMKKAIGSTAWPHCLVMSSDWIVRWQGHPASLTAEILGQIVEANGGESATKQKIRRWSR